MNKLLAMVIAAALLTAGLMPQTARAAAAEITVIGVVSDHGYPAAGASVMVICTDTRMGKSSRTDSGGRYSISFTSAECPLGTPIRVQSAKAAKAGFVTNVIQGAITKIDVVLADISIPEYGWIGSLVAAGAGMGAIILARRRYAFES